MVEIAFFARRAKISIRETLQRLKDAGVDSMPGGGAEIFSERVRRIICDHKIDGNEWIETARAAHDIGLKDELHDALWASGELRRIFRITWSVYDRCRMIRTDS